MKRITVYVRVKLLQMSCNDGDGCTRDVEVIAHFEVYDGLPLTAKWIEVSALFAKILASCRPYTPMCGKLGNFPINNGVIEIKMKFLPCSETPARLRDSAPVDS